MRVTPARKTSGLRVLGRLRLSRSSEESTSIERQREIISQWASANDHHIVGWAEDENVSGAVDVMDPENKTQLGDWIQDRHPEFDTIAVWKLDRLSRNTINLNKLISWCQDHEKTITSVTESIDLGTPIGRLIAYVIGFLAEGELDAIREVQRGSRSKLRELARWPGGKPPYGYLAARNKNSPGWHLKVDPKASRTVRRIVESFLDGIPSTAIARALNDEGVLTPGQYYDSVGSGTPTLTLPYDQLPKDEHGNRKPGWHVSALRNMLRSPALLGRLHHTVHSGECASHGGKWCRTHCSHGQTVRGDDGMPVQVADPLVSLDEWDRIQARLDGHLEARKDARRSEASPLSGLVFCLECSQPLHHDFNVITRGDKRYEYRYYRCRAKHTKLPAEELELLAEESFLRELGDLEVRERVWVRGDSHEAELREAVAGYDELLKTAGRAVSATAKQRLQSQLAALDRRIAELEALPFQEARWEYRPTGQMYWEVWQASDTDARRDLLYRSGITFGAKVIGKRGSKAREFELRLPDELLLPWTVSASHERVTK
jgi:site-specific DNA recombinase